MTLEEKMDYIGGVHAMSIRAIPRLGVPEIRMSDGPLGVRQDTPSTRYPAGAALAASFDPELARAEGAAIGRDCRARGIHILLAPGINIQRVPVGGRNFEYLSGEDPYLAARLVAPFVQGVQHEGVIATVKHFAANNQEYNRERIDVQVDERALQEIYLPAFKAAIQQGGALAVMDAYNKLNGKYCTENGELNRTLLKSEWGFSGIVMSDWGATHSCRAAVLGGLDLEMPSGQFFNQANLRHELASGQIQQSDIDDKVFRILSTIIRMGFLDREQKDPAIPLNNPTSRQVALRVAEEGTVLLKNEGDVLPLDRAIVSRIAVLGPAAEPGVPTGYGSSLVQPFEQVSAVEGLKKVFGAGVRVDYFTEGGGDYGTARFAHEDSDGEIVPGLKGEYFANPDLVGSPAKVRDDPEVDFRWYNGVAGIPDLPERFSVRWTGTIRPWVGGTHVFRVRSDDRIRVYLDDALIIDDWVDHAPKTDTATRQLEADRTYRLRIEYRNSAGGAVAQFAWAPVQVPEGIRSYDAAVVCVGFNDGSEGEGFDRTFSLPDAQDELIQQVARKNPKTIVVLYAGAAVDCRAWVGQVPALLHAWYPGQEGGEALAEILAGKVNPSAKLPATFEAGFEQNPAFSGYPSQDGGRSVRYAEGVFVGYRGFERASIMPLFPFGFGLSYTTFAYSDLAVTSQAGGRQVQFRLTNTGTRAGTEISELYVHPVHPAVDRPIQELKGFVRTELKPGETRWVEMDLPRQALAYFDPKGGRWVIDEGDYEVRIGRSSRDIVLRSEFAESNNVGTHRQGAGATQ
jgi:beta-glucosidase